MLHRHFAVAVACSLAVLVSALPLRADLASAEATLKGKGLVKQGPLYVLPEEAELNKGMGDLRKVQTDMTKVSREMDKVERKVSQVKAAIATKEFDARKLNEELAKPGVTPQRNNEIIAKLDIIDDDIKKITVGPLKAAQEELSKANDGFIKARQGYIEKTVALAAIGEKIKATYAKLADETEVIVAIGEVEKESGKKVALGPSGPCKANLVLVDRGNKTILSEAIPVKVENDVPHVDVLLNGKYRRSMVFDSGASTVSVPWDLAKELGLTPSADTTKVRLQLADGKIVEAWLMSLKSVQVGPFTVEDVECAVLPESLIAAEPLLGGSFLSHFVYKLDLKSQKLDMTKVKSPGEK